MGKISNRWASYKVHGPEYSYIDWPNLQNRQTRDGQSSQNRKGKVHSANSSKVGKVHNADSSKVDTDALKF